MLKGQVGAPGPEPSKLVLPPFGQPRHAGLRNPVREGAGHGGGSAGDVQSGVDGFQVGAHSSLGYAQAAGDLGVGAPGGEQMGIRMGVISSPGP
jgi:hypothetical protein